MKAVEEDLQNKLKEERKKIKEINEEGEKLKKLLRQKEAEVVDLGREVKNEKRKSLNLTGNWKQRRIHRRSLTES